jgi:hypothetical protein
MRATVDLPPGVHSRVRQLAQHEGQSVSATLAHLVRERLDEIDLPERVTISPVTGMPQIDLGFPITSQYVSDMVEEDQ